MRERAEGVFVVLHSQAKEYRLTKLCSIRALALSMFGKAKGVYSPRYSLDQGLFCHDQVSSGKFLPCFNL